MIHLSKREIEVMQGVAHGCTHEKIGLNLGISRRTVDAYVSSVLKKTGSPSSTAAVSLLTSEGLVTALRPSQEQSL